MNTQPIEKPIKNDPGTYLDIIQIFSTLQGEGPFTGERAIFIRLAGCNLQCPGCDTQYTEGKGTFASGEIVKSVIALAPNPFLVVITGGEPFRQNITPLSNTLVMLGYKVQIETNGTLPIPLELNDSCHIVCSPKTRSIHRSVPERAKFFKYVLDARSVCSQDGLPINVLDDTKEVNWGTVWRAPSGKTIYLQPMDTGDRDLNEHNKKAVVESCLKFGYLLQLQIHKLIGVE